MSVGFVHLKVHSEYSLADSIIRLRPLLDNCYARKIPAVAITDLCNMFAAIKFYKAALSTGIKPIFGSDLIIESNDQHYELNTHVMLGPETTTNSDGLRQHITSL